MCLHLSSSRSSARTLDAFADHFLRFRQLTNLCYSLVRAALEGGGKGGGVGLVSWKLLHLMQQTQIIDAARCGKLNVQVFGPLYKSD